MRKLIEVALPLEAINRESAREKSIRHGHPSTLHLWWARRPLAACRAIIFASLVDDPSSHPELFPTDESQEAERQRLFRIIEDLVKWENTTNEVVLDAARAEIMRSCDGHPPAVLDPFCGGGSIPLEAQRLGLEAHASDLNPVAVLITKALIEIPPKFAGRPPVHPDADRLSTGGWKGAQGLAEDVRYYGKWMRDDAERRVGYLYPQVNNAGMARSPIAWFWTRVALCPNPACGREMPLTSSYWLSRKPGREAWLVPELDFTNGGVSYSVRSGVGDPPNPPKRARAGQFECVWCHQLAGEEYIKKLAKESGLRSRLVAVVVEGDRRRIYLPATNEMEEAALNVSRGWASDAVLSTHPQYMGPPRYGLTHHGDLFTRRQGATIGAFQEALENVRGRIRQDAVLRRTGVDDGYVDAVVTYLAFVLDKGANYWTAVCGWHEQAEKLVSTFGLPVLRMTWDFVEANPFSQSSGNWMSGVDLVAKVLATLPTNPVPGVVQLADARRVELACQALICTDPPYYDNIPYADLSDFFYVLLRAELKTEYAREFATVLTPKADELVADQTRHGGKKGAADFFESGLHDAFLAMTAIQDGGFPMTVFYAFRQSEAVTGLSDAQAQISTGWERMLGGLVSAGFQVVGTWPVRTEQPGGLRQAGRNALASSIAIVCRERPKGAALASRREFVEALKSRLPKALRNLQQGNIAPVDLAQAAIGPGMGVFSQYAKIIEADGSPMVVRTALGLINQVLDQTLSEQENDFDGDTRWALAWFEEVGMNLGAFGKAETLSTAKNTSIRGLVEAGLLESKAGRVRLKDRTELPEDWVPERKDRLTVWEVAQHLTQALDAGGEVKAAAVLRRVGGLGETARELAYRLYVICERKKWAKEALAYNSLVVAWPEIVRLAGAGIGPTQEGML